MDSGILPIKDLNSAKGRLSESLDDPARRRVAEALALDALDLVAGPGPLRWWVVSNDDEILERALSLGLDHLRDPGEGLNHALGMALATVTEAGAGAALILPADLPLATRDDIGTLLETAETSELVLVPSGEDGGTNAMVVTPPTSIEPRFGPGSLRNHLAMAEAQRIRCTVLPLPTLALDIDTYEDLERFVASGPRSGRTYGVCSALVPAGT